MISSFGFSPFFSPSPHMINSGSHSFRSSSLKEREGGNLYFSNHLNIKF